MNQVHIETPLQYSKKLSKQLRCNVFLKLENLQPSTSFKIRGVGNFCLQVARKHPSATLVIASGGNAGLAASHAAALLGMKCVVFLPQSAPSYMVKLLEMDGARVVVEGRNYSQALAASVKYASENNGVCVPAYDDPDVIEGNSSLIPEMKRQFNAALGPEAKPAAIIASVGGGGLLGGLLLGAKRDVDWQDTPFVAVETHGANCLYQSVEANRNSKPKQTTQDPLVVPLEEITSRATSLGARTPTIETLKMSLQMNVHCVTISDKVALEAAALFLDQEKLLVELACSATLAIAYHSELLTRLFPQLQLGDFKSNFVKPDPKRASLIFIVCGGSRVQPQDLDEKIEIDEGVLISSP